MSPATRWTVAIGGLVAYDVYCDRNDTPGDTLSECTRAVFRTHHPRGRIALTAAWLALTAWLLPHLCDTLEEPDTGH